MNDPSAPRNEFVHRELRSVYEAINPEIDRGSTTRPRFLNIGIDAANASSHALASAASLTGDFAERDHPAVLFAAEFLHHCPIDGATIAEFGAGRGGNLLVAARLGSPRAMVAVDLALAGFASIRQDSDGAIRPLQAAAECSPFRSESVDVVLSIEASAYVPNVVDLYREAHRVLRQGARFVLHVPSWSVAGRRRHLRALRELGFDLVHELDVTDGYVGAFRQRQDTVGAALEGTTFGVGMELMASGHLRTAVLHLDKSNRPPVTEVRPLPDESASARRALAELLDRHQVTGLF